MMKKLCYILFLVTFSCICLANDSAKQLMAILTPLQNMQAHFEQTIVDKNGRVLEKTSGQMALLRPGKFRWDTEKPGHQLLIADGAKIWLYDESLKQVTVQSQTQKTASPVMLLSDPNSTLTEQFNIHCAKSTAEKQTCTLFPKNKADMFQKIELFFEGGLLKQMQLSDHLGQKTVILFRDVKVNTSTDPKLFTFIPPQGVDIVKGQ